MILLIDNYDSFTYNLYQYLCIFHPDVRVVRNDRITTEQIAALQPEKIVLSPGPKSPKEAGICMETVRTFAGQIPILGICLGHQCIAEAFGGVVGYAKTLMHGKQSRIQHEPGGIFSGTPENFLVARYHSLAIEEDTLPSCLRVTARAEDGEIMAVQHKEFAVTGLQFHPESVFTEYGKRMIENFVNGGAEV